TLRLQEQSTHFNQGSLKLDLTIFYTSLPNIQTVKHPFLSPNAQVFC
ncbi:MAG: hypothetical protein ACI9EH_001163, partial [Planktomarina sp.]